MSKSTHLLVIRFSAMGDVALTIPAMLSVVEARPDVTITFLTRPFYASFIPSHPRIKVVGIEFDHYKGVFGLRKLAKEILAQHQFDSVVDLHNVLRSKVITSFFRLKGKEITTFKKMRNEKRRILSHRSNQQLPHVVEQYLNTFRLAGFKAELISGPWIKPEEKEELTDFLNQNTLNSKPSKWIGIAPFAAHPAKVWGIEYIQQLMHELTKKGYSVFLFGGGKQEIEQLDNLENKEKNIYSVAGKIPFNQELALMKKLDSLVCMDSSNMHFGTLIDIPVISVWGATTPLLGFYPLNNQQRMVKVPKEELKKLTLSGYGNKEASNGYDWKTRISIDDILKKIEL